MKPSRSLSAGTISQGCSCNLADITVATGVVFAVIVGRQEHTQVDTMN